VRKPLVKAGLGSIAANVRALRERQGMSQEELASRASLIDARYVRFVESASANPSAEKLLLIADALGVTVGRLFRPATFRPRSAGRPARRSGRRPATPAKPPR